jgi:hypothetical protein
MKFAVQTASQAKPLCPIHRDNEIFAMATGDCFNGSIAFLNLEHYTRSKSGNAMGSFTHGEFGRKAEERAVFSACDPVFGRRVKHLQQSLPEA